MSDECIFAGAAVDFVALLFSFIIHLVGGGSNGGSVEYVRCYCIGQPEIAVVSASAQFCSSDELVFILASVRQKATVTISSDHQRYISTPAR